MSCYNNEVNWAEYVGQRCIIVKNEYGESAVEVLVVEVSPSGRWVKFWFPSGIECWEGKDTYLLIEALNTGGER